MQVPFDFYTTLIDSGSVIIVILIASLIIFATRVREIYADIGIGTRRALMAYATAGIAMAVATLTAISPEVRFMVTGVGALFLGSIVIAQLWILVSERRAKQGTIGTFLMIVGVFINNFLNRFYSVPLYFMMIALSILLIGSLYFAVVLLRENPSTFSASLLLVLILYMSTWVIAATGWIFDNPEYYILQVIPLIFAATIFSTIRRPGRTTLAVFIMYFTFTIGVPILSSAYNAADWVTFSFVGVELFTVFCLISPLNYFLDQHAESGAKTPLYLGAVVAFLALLVSTHSLSWAVFIQSGLVWNNYIVWVDVIIGCSAIVAFVLAVVSSLYGDWAETFTREALIIFSTAAAFLTFPLTQPNTPGQLIITNDMVWLAIGVVVIIGTLLFTRLSYKIAKAGGGKAARNLMLFVVSAIMIAIVSMYSDNIPPKPPEIPIVVITLLLIADIMSVFSNPNFITEAKRRLRRGSVSSEVIS